MGWFESPRGKSKHNERSKKKKGEERKAKNAKWRLRNNYFVNWKKEKRKEEDFRLRFKTF